MMWEPRLSWWVIVVKAGDIFLLSVMASLYLRSPAPDDLRRWVAQEACMFMKTSWHMKTLPALLPPARGSQQSESTSHEWIPVLLRTLLLTGVNFNPSIRNEIHHKMLNKTAYPVQNFNSVAVELREWINNFIPNIFRASDPSSMLKIKVNLC